MLRSRVFSRVVHVLPLRMAGALVLLMVGVSAGARLDPMEPWVAALVAGRGACGRRAQHWCACRRSRGARLKRVLDWSEFVLVVVMVVMTAGALGVFAWVRSMF